MSRSLFAVPAMLCLAAALVTAQAPAPDRPADNAPAAEQPASPQQPAAQQPAPATPRPSTQTPSTQTRGAAEPSTSAANKVTYVGCVKPGATAGTWILEHAEVAQRSGATAATPTPAVGTSGMAKMTFNLDPAATVNLKPHANHKVEVVGTIAPLKTSGEVQAGVADPAATTSATARQQFSVESMKMVSSTCP